MPTSQARVGANVTAKRMGTSSAPLLDPDPERVDERDFLRVTEDADPGQIEDLCLLGLVSKQLY